MIRALASSKTIMSFTVEKIDGGGVVINRYCDGDIATSRLVTTPFPQAVEGVQEELKAFEKNPLTRITRKLLG